MTCLQDYALVKVSVHRWRVVRLTGCMDVAYQDVFQKREVNVPCVIEWEYASKPLNRALALRKLRQLRQTHAPNPLHPLTGFPGALDS